jgi:hypothetical protein
MTTLDLFHDAGWSSSKLSGNPKRDGVKGTLPEPAGLSTANTKQVDVKIRIKSLDAQWLPVPAVPSKVQVEGPWLYDERSETVFGIRTGTKKLKKSYQVTAIRAQPDRALLAQNPDTGGPPSIQQYALDPGNEVTDYVRQLTETVISGAHTNYEKVVAIQAFFATTNGFKYSKTTQVPGIDSPSALEDFLKGKRGFCEQYASAMAAMVRIAGVPARVAVGFTAGTPQPDGTYTVTTDDAHAWPEAWFSGTGWVRFEPTPRADGQTTVPDYATAAGSTSNAPGTTVGGPEPTPGPSGSSDKANALLDKLDRLDNAPVAGPDQTVPTGHRPSTSFGLAALIVLAALLVLPRLLHLVRRRRRWRGGGALAGWAQVYDDAVDMGHVWRPADSPRAAAAALAQRHALDAPARDALGRLALAAERARYAPDSSTRAGSVDATGLYDAAAVVRSALLSGVSRTTRWRAWLLPTSTLRWASSALGTFVADVLDGFDNAWSALPRLRSRGARPV